MNNPTEVMRQNIDKIVNDIMERAREMVRQDVPVETAFKLAISWELEVLMLHNQMQVIAFIAKNFPQVDPKQFGDVLKPKTG